MTWQAWFYQSGYLRARGRTPRSMTSALPATIQVSKLRLSSIAKSAQPSLVRPTGSGYYAIEDLGVGTDLRAAVAKVPAGGTLTLPPGTFVLPDFTMQGPYGLVTASVGIVGSGPETIITVPPNVAVPTSSTPTIIRFGGGAQKIGQFSVVGTPQNIGGAKYDYHLIMTANQDGGRLFDLLLKGNNGSFNSPVTRTISGVAVGGQGETFSLNLFRSNNMLLERVETDGRDSNGVKQNATGIGINNCVNVTLRSCSTHHTGYSHGVAIYRSKQVYTYDHVAEYIGTAGTGSATAGTQGDGLNCEQSFDTHHYNPRIGFCTLSHQRYYGNADTATGTPSNGENFGGDTYPHTVDGLICSDGVAQRVRIDNLQSTLPVYTNSPVPVYAYS